MITFGVQDRINSFVRAHTFAIFVREEDDRLETKTISWLPKSNDVCLFCPAETGRNFSLEESIEDPVNDGRKVTAWGPYLIKEELYRRASAQIDFLESGKILFKAIDAPQRFHRIATNCEHAVSDVDIDSGYLHTGTKHGNSGTRAVTRHLRRWMIPTQENLSYLWKRLGLDKYPIHKQ